MYSAFSIAALLRESQVVGGTSTSSWTGVDAANSDLGLRRMGGSREGGVHDPALEFRTIRLGQGTRWSQGGS